MNAADFGKVAVLMGGPSAERDVSLNSGARVLAALKASDVDAHGIDADPTVLKQLREEQFDCAFIVLHGRWGEDGVIQGALEVLGIPYTGSGVLASALAMDKWRSKLILRQAGIPTADFELVKSISDLPGVAERLGLPLFIKPSREGSSIGTAKVHNLEEMEQAWRKAREFDDDVLAETWIDGPELTAAILGDQVLPLIRIEAASGFYDYDAKYVGDDTRYHCPTGLSAETEQQVSQWAKQAFDVLGCRGWGRVDFMLDKDNKPFVLEANTIPGMTDHSLVPMAAKSAGMDFQQLTLRILEQARV
ncbi:MAG: D-alanine--D-alanine ligase [Acidiferrobacterales bacterium]|jgi:D-alanine-D-alanine ligase|nr:D-alanine--D-alanine ligase [Acidiferrobacterales bacterium]